MASLFSSLLPRCARNFQALHPQLPCPICDGMSSPFDVVDFNKCCEEPRGKFLALAGIPVYYYRCEHCGFCFAPEIARWNPAEFKERIYNDDYALVDPDYLEQRPHANANTLLEMFGSHTPSIRHLDYGGGNGLLSELLSESGWQSTSYDPFVDHKTRLNQLGKFNLITAFEVFEHVPDPRQLMADLKKLLAPDGIILLTTLLSDSHVAPYTRLTWWYASPRNGHISLYSRNSLLLLTNKSGFQFGSFNDAFHGLCREIPGWAAHIFSRPTAQK